MQFRLALAPVVLAACGGSYTLTEDEGVTIAHDVFATHNIVVGSTRPMGPLPIDDVDVEFTVDRWSLANGVGYEYVSEDDPDFDEAVTDLGSDREVPRLQTAVDLFLEAEPGHRVLIIRTWGHETADLAKNQLEGYVELWLTDHGY